MNPKSQTIIIKSDQEINLMREAGKYHAELIEKVREFIKPGQTPYEIDKFAHKICKELDVIPAQIGYEDYPSATCVGVNDDAVHCIPSKDKVIKDGDIVTFDTVILKDGWHADGGFTIGIGKVDSEGKRLIATCKKALRAAIKATKPGARTKDISKAVHRIATQAGFTPIKKFAAHGLGKNIHEPPSIPNHTWNGPSPVLKKGMVLALDTMICEGQGEVDFLEDGWSTKTKDGKRFAFFEHTVAITEKGAEILTKK